MEYLMTYGWAILIIAVVLAALFQLGVFNTSSFSPRAPPGACQVVRPGGPGTATNINVMGVCTGQLPQYVSVFNGANSYATTSAFTMGLFTISAWIYPRSTPTDGNIGQVVASDYYGLGGMFFYFSSGRLIIARTHNIADYNAQSDITLPLNQWSFVATTLDSSALKVYVNGIAHGTVTPASNNAIYGAIYIGAASHTGGGSNNFNGMISNIQIYNSSFSANEIQALYLEGVGGAPINPQYLVGWWPLNGDVKDYGGNNNNGAPTAVTFTSQYGK